MKLREWDWDKQSYVEIDYPDPVLADFLNWLRTTKAWHTDGEIVHRRVRRLNDALAAHRQTVKEAELKAAAKPKKVPAGAAT